MQKKGLKLNESRIGKGDDGFEDLDQFWDAADTNTTFRTSIASRLSDAGESLNYDDTGSISGASIPNYLYFKGPTTRPPPPLSACR